MFKVDSAIGHLPVELEWQVLSYMKPSDLARCCQVSKVWKKNLEKEALWNQALPELPSQIKSDKITFFKKMQGTSICTSKEDLFTAVTSFFNQVSLYQHATFRCSFLDDPHSFLRIELIPEKSSVKREPIQRNYIFTGQLSREPNFPHTSESHFIKTGGVKFMGFQVVQKKPISLSITDYLPMKENKDFISEILVILKKRKNELKKTKLEPLCP
jgi:F-box-like